MALPPLDLSTGQPGGWPPDPFSDPIWYRGVIWRRIFAYGVDIWLIALILFIAGVAVWLLTAASLGLLLVFHPLIWPLFLLTPLLYHSLLLSGGSAATFGMRLFGLKAHSLLGGRPSLAQALVHTACFYGSMAVTAALILVIALFNPRRRTMHDVLAGVVVLRNMGS